MEVYPEKIDGTPHHAHGVMCTVHFFRCITPSNIKYYSYFLSFK